jgi:hypothetical protein
VRVPGLENPEIRERVLTATAPPAAARTRGAPAAGTIRGQVRLDDAIASPGEGVLFVIVRSSSGGPPLAAVRIPAASFPQAFEVGPADAMIRGRPLAGPVMLTARFDRDGDPMTRSADDLVAELDGTVEPGGEQVLLVLSPSGS